eukprot:9074466-Lingulodinium_polyedra.AAC.1
MADTLGAHHPLFEHELFGVKPFAFVLGFPVLGRLQVVLHHPPEQIGMQGSIKYVVMDAYAMVPPASGHGTKVPGTGEDGVSIFAQEQRDWLSDEHPGKRLPCSIEDADEDMLAQDFKCLFCLAHSLGRLWLCIGDPVACFPH